MIRDILMNYEMKTHSVSPEQAALVVDSFLMPDLSDDIYNKSNYQ